MMAMFFAQRVILGKTNFDEVPKALKAKVAEILLDSGLPELVPSELEKEYSVLDERIRVANHRIDDLEEIEHEG